MPSIAEINEILEEAEDPRLRPKERATLLAYADQQTDVYWRERRQNDFLEFFRFIRPDFKIAEHHKVLAEVVQRAESTPNAREIVNLPPRAGKSEEISVAGTAWVIGRHPSWKVLQLCLNDTLVEEFGRKTRDLIESDEFKSVFPNVKLHPSSRAVDSFATTVTGSKYLARGTLSNIHGFGGDWIVIDDPVGDKNCDPAGQDRAYTWYQRGPRIRLQPEGRILAVMSRWPGNDFCGRLLADEASGRGDSWNLTKIPAYTFDEETGEKIWYWPEHWATEFMEHRERTTPKAIWKSQFMQEGVPDDGASAIPENRWRIWPYVGDQLHLPVFTFIIQSWDTAFTERKESLRKSSASACTTWGVFYLPDQSKNIETLHGQAYNNTGEIAQVMLLDCYKGYIEFPALKRIALNQYRSYKPDEIWIEGRASGKPLLQELRQMGLPMRDYTPTSGETKEVRLAAVSDLFASGVVWTLDFNNSKHQHLYEVISQLSKGPGGSDSDLCDSSSQALRRFRKGGFLKSGLDDSEIWDRPTKKRKRWQAVYG